jgi:DNA-binding protein YbaB
MTEPDPPIVPEVMPDLPEGFPDLSQGMPDLGELLGGLNAVQELQDATYEGTAGGGLVRIRSNGRMDVQSVEISPSAVEEGDPELLSDLVLAALHDLTANIAKAQRDALGPLGDLLGGGGLPGAG